MQCKQLTEGRQRHISSVLQGVIEKNASKFDITVQWKHNGIGH